MDNWAFKVRLTPEDIIKELTTDCNELGLRYIYNMIKAL